MKLPVLAAALVAVFAGPAFAQSTNSATVTTPAGKTATASSVRSQGDVAGSVELGNGQVATRNVERAPGSTTATTTGFGGQTAVRQTNRADGDASGQVTTSGGKTATRNVDRYQGGATATTSGFRGGTGTRTRARR